jgi:hypothetical protein
MATIEQGLLSYLTGYSGLVSLISTRVYWMTKPAGVTYPCLTYQRISTPRIHTHDTSGATGTAYPRFQFDAWATTYASAKAITEQLRAALNGKTGSIGSGANTITLMSSLVDAEVPDYDAETNLYRSRSDYIIWHAE